ncbi:hypothetical protein J0H58_13325 [bacterium]|nr:hypothetical protein [bacterium]
MDDIADRYLADATEGDVRLVRDHEEFLYDYRTGTMNTAQRLLLACGLGEIWGWDTLDVRVEIVARSVQDWDDGGGCSAHLYADGSIAVDDGGGYHPCADLASMLDYTGWDAHEFEGWDDPSDNHVPVADWRREGF